MTTPIREQIPKISKERLSHYTFAASFNGAKPEQNDRLYKKLLIVYHDFSQFVKSMTRIEEIRFQYEKLSALELTKFGTFSTNLGKKNQVQIQGGSI